MKRKWIVALAIIAGLVTLLLLSELGSEDAPEVHLSKAVRQPIKSSILASGALAFKDQVKLRSEVFGTVSDVLVQEGDIVAKNDVALRIDPETFRARMEKAEANVRMQQIAIERQKLQIATLQNQWERKRELHNRQLLDEDTFESASLELAMAKVDLRSRQEALNQAQADLDQAREELDKTMIRSPMAGIVTTVDVKPGESVIAGTTNIQGTTLVGIGDPSEILAEVHVDEADIPRVQVGQEAQVNAVAFPDDPMHGTVQSIGTTAQPSNENRGLSFTVKVKIVDAGALDVRPGMSCRVEIFHSTTDDTLAVPIEAVQYDADEGENAAESAESAYVMVYEDGVALRRTVKTGMSDDTDIAILEGLQEGEQVITGPYRTLHAMGDGDAVEPAAMGNTESKEPAE